MTTSLACGAAPTRWPLPTHTTSTASRRLGESCGHAPEVPRAAPCNAAERAHEVRQVSETHLVGDGADRQCALRQQFRRTPQTRAHQVLVGCHAGHPGEEAQEVKGADAAPTRHLPEIERLVRVCIEPQRHPYCAAAIARGHPD